MPTVHLGCSGFLYDHWKGPFYPDDLPKKRWFDYYCTAFSSLELNVTFYRLPDRDTVARWYRASPRDFVFAVKGSRFITHIKRLKGVAGSLDLFFSRILALKEKLGVVLWQLPPRFPADPPRLHEFLKTLGRYGARNAFEFRDATWVSRTIVSLLEEANASFCLADWPAFADALPLTAGFVYLRRHGKGGTYATSYTRAELNSDAVRIGKYLGSGRDVFIYFNNDAFGYAPKNAQELKKMLEP